MIEVRVTPRSSRPGVAVEGGVVRCYLAAAPVDGAANGALVELLAALLGVPRRAVEIRRGHRSRTKFVAIDGLDDAEAIRRLSIV